MNLFKRESGKNARQAKIALLASVQKNTDEYIIAQRDLNHLLQNWDGVEDITSKIADYTGKMAHFHTKSKEVCNTYQLLFNKELDVDKILQVAIDEHYPILNEQMNAPVGGCQADFDGFGPKDSGDPIKEAIIDALCKKTGVSRDDIHITGGKIDKGVLRSLNPENFSGIEEFLEAASKQSEALNSGKSGEEIISDAVIKTTEAKLNKKKSIPLDDTGKTPKTDA